MILYYLSVTFSFLASETVILLLRVHKFMNKNIVSFKYMNVVLKKRLILTLNLKKKSGAICYPSTFYFCINFNN